MAGRKGPGTWAKISLLLAATALASGCQSTSFMQNAFKPVGGGGGGSASGGAGGRFDCFREPTGGVGPDFSVMAYPSQESVKAIGQECLAVALRPSARESYANITRAHFYAGRANLELGRRYLEQRNPDAQGALGVAAQELETVVSNTRGDLAPPTPTPTDRPARARSPAEEQQRKLAIKARLELSQTYMLLQRPQDAIDRITQILNVDPTNLEASYARAKVIVNLSRRGDGEALNAAVTDLSIFSGELKNEDPAVVAEGRKELIVRARELGELASKTQTTDATMRAITAYTKAKDAAVQAEKEKIVPAAVTSLTFSDLGRAQLQMAGLSGPRASADFGCAANGGSFTWVSAAFTSFGEAVRYDASQAGGHDGKGCALQAQGNTNQAVEEFQEAARLDERNVTYRLRLARALDASRRPQDAEQAYNAALGLAQGDKAQTARIHAQIADIHFKTFQENGDPKELEIASHSLDESIKADGGYAPARVMRGNLYFAKRRTARLAITDLVEAVSSSKFTNDKMLEADAYYALSRIKTDPESRSPAEAIDYAKRAADIGGRPAYKEQVCLAYIQFLTPPRLRDGAVYCAAGDNPPIRAVLREGMYHLRATFFTRGYEQDKGWERALDAFELGLKRYAEGTAGEQEQTQNLKSQLVLGKSFALGCIGLTTRANDVLRDVGDKDQAAAEFNKYDIGKCATRYRY